MANKWANKCRSCGTPVNPGASFCGESCEQRNTCWRDTDELATSPGKSDQTLVEELKKLSKDIREYQRRITAAFTVMDRIMSIAPSELRPERSVVHELVELSFARIRAALNGDILGPSPNPPGRYPNVAAFPEEA